jgi:hypothetical protein
MTTCYFFKDVSCSGNTGYGIYIEGASSCNFTNVLCQTNVQGGLKINKVAGYAGSYFMTNLVFNNFYTEGNGTLTSNDPNFEGNCGVYITGYDKTSSSAGKARGIKFNGGSINAIAGGIAVKIDAVWGCKFSCAIGGTVDIASVGVYGLEFDTEPSGATVLDIGSSMALTSYHTITIPGKVFNGGLFPMRGRTQIYEFYLPTIAAGTTVNMNSLYQLTGITGITKGYAMLSKGSILGVKITKRGGYGGGYAGTITAKPVYYAGPDLKTDPPNPFSGNPNVALNGGLSDVTKSSYYPPDTYKFNADSVVGVQLTTSADYVAGTYDGYIAQLMVEI